MTYKNLAYLPLLGAFLPLASAQTTSGSPSSPAPLTSYANKITQTLERLEKGTVPKGDDALVCANLKSSSLTLLEIANSIVNLECTNELGFLRYMDRSSSAYHAFLRIAEENLSNHAPGSTATSAGSSSLVSKAAVPEVIGFAVDVGALTQSSSGSTSTFTANARGLYRYLRNQEVYLYCPSSLTCDRGLSGAARRLTGSISLDNTNSNSATAPTAGTTSSPSASTPPATISGSGWRMSAWGIQYQIPIGHFDTNGPQFRKAWDNQMAALAKSSGSALATSAANLNAKLADAFDDVILSQAYKDWRKSAQADIANLLGQTPLPSQVIVEEKLREHLDILVSQVNEQKLGDKLAAALAAANEFFANRESVVNTVTGTLPGLSFAYTNSHPLNQANVSNFKMVFQIQPKPGTFSLTANVAADIYDALPAASKVGRWRDLQVAAQADYTLPTRFGNPVLSIAGYYQYQATNAVLQITAGSTVPGTNIVLNGSAPALLAPKGDIKIAQALITFPVKNGTTKIPVGVSYASRTELLTGSVVRAHIGVNFDFDQLFMK